MRLKKYARALSCFMVFVMLTGIILGADKPEAIKAITQGKPLYTVQYDDYDITARWIKVEGSNNVAYCLEINKKYPSGQSFTSIGKASANINNILAAGFPNRSAAELNLDNDNEAYFATQLAIWSGMEGYDVNAFKGTNPKILEAIKSIYINGMNGKYANKIRTTAYITNDETIQDIIVVHVDDLIAEQKAESIQKEYAPQEG